MINPSQITKVALGVIGASTVIGSGFGIHSALQDKTINDAIIRKGKKLIDNKDVFEIAFKQHREEQAFLTLISTADKTIEKATDLNKGGPALNAWCNEKLKLDLTEENIQKVLPNAEKYCSLPPLMTMKEKMGKLNKKLASDWTKQLTSIGEDTNSDLKATLATVNSAISSENSTKQEHQAIWKAALKTWCEEKENTPLIRDKNDEIFKKMEKYCFEKTTEQA